MAKAEGNGKGDGIAADILAKFEGSPHLIIAVALLVFLLVSMLIQHDVTTLLFNLIVIGSTGFLGYLSISGFGDLEKNRWNILPALMGLALLSVAFQSPGQALLIILITFYMILSALVSGKLIKLQTAIIIGLALTAVIFRVYPTLPGSGNMPGHLISMDDPYYHYKQTDKLYRMGNIPKTDYTIYPPEGKGAPHKFPYYYNAYLALLTGNPIRDITLLYPVLISAFGAIMMFFFLKELTSDWKTGMLGGFFFATMPVLLTKSAAGAIEEDLMGMVLGIFSLYLLAKAVKSAGRENTKYATLAGIAFFITLISWKGILFLFAIPFAALAIYALVSIILKYDIWNTTRAAIIAGVIPIIGNMVFLNGFQIQIQQVGPYGAMLFMGVLAEFIRLRVWKGEDSKQGLEKKYFTQFAVLVLIGALVGLFALGVERIVDIPQKAFEEFAGTSGHNFLVDKTISEQAALARGDLIQKLSAGYPRYNVAEPLTVIMAVLIPIFLLYYYFKDRDRMFELLRAYLICLIFFLIAMEFVWVEARLAFSQALGFLLLGSMVGLMLPGSWKEINSWKVIVLLVIIVIIPFTTFYPHNGADAWKQTKRAAAVDPAWFLGVQWLDENIKPGQYVGDQYINGDYVLTWWDYGHFITALSRATVIADPLQGSEEYIMRIARFFYNTTSEGEALKWLMEQPWNQKDENGDYKVKYIILDYSLIGKAGALSFLGTNYYQVPNGQTTVDGLCEVGEICQNVENGVVAEKKDGEYVCSEGVVCTRDAMTGVDKKECCEANPTKCCDFSFNWRVINEGGSAKLLRRPGTAVYGQYQLNKQGSACRPEYSTSLEPTIFVDNGQRKTATRRYLYTGFSGLRYADGGDYPAFLMLVYADGSQDMRFISSNCETKDYNEVMASGKDALINMRYGQRLSNDVVAPQIFIHVPERWINSMFTELYLFDAANLDYFNLISDDKTKAFYPSVKIYKVTYPDEVPEVPEQPDFSAVSELDEVPEPETGARNGDLVEVHYTGSFENGTVFDSSTERGPLPFTVGAGEVIPGFENAVMGMQVGETKKVTIPPEQAYGTSGSHPLAGKTLVFEITLVSLNGGEVQALVDEEVEGLNMTFDYYDPSLVEAYGLENFPSVVWNCQYKKVGEMSDLDGELDALRKITCVVNRAEPVELCSSLGITYSEEENSIRADSTINEVLSTVNKLEEIPSCAPEVGKSTIQVFYSQVCDACEGQKPLLDQLGDEFGEYANVTYYCVGDEDYCLENSITTV